MTSRYVDQFPEWEIVIGECPPGGPWVKARAVGAAARSASGDVFLVADADCWSDGVGEAVEHVESGQAAWVVPHTGVFRLDEQSTDALLSGRETPRRYVGRPYKGTVGGGLVVVPRSVMDDTPLDPRFEGFGQEDESWGWALRALYGEPLRLAHPLLHLWHPPQHRMTRRHGSIAGKRLAVRYARAVRGRDGDPQAAMRELIEEAKHQ